MLIRSGASLRVQPCRFRACLRPVRRREGLGQHASRVIQPPRRPPCADCGREGLQACHGEAARELLRASGIEYNGADGGVMSSSRNRGRPLPGASVRVSGKKHRRWKLTDRVRWFAPPALTCSANGCGRCADPRGFRPTAPFLDAARAECRARDEVYTVDAAIARPLSRRGPRRDPVLPRTRVRGPAPQRVQVGDRDPRPPLEARSPND